MDKSAVCNPGNNPSIRSGIVSVCIPCYNVELYIGKHIDSLLKQTYRNLELIFVNDGSTDSTLSIIEQFEPLLKNRGYDVRIITQENQGLAGAINVALKHFTGEFLIWPDPDDWLTPDSIEKRVSFLRKHPEAALVRSNMRKVDYETGKEYPLPEENNIDHPQKLDFFFDDLFLGKTWFGASACMLRTEAFLSVYPDREIYVSRPAAQNIQILFPIAYKYECWQLPDVMCYYLIRASSHFHSVKSIESRLAYQEMLEDVIAHVLEKISAPSHYFSLLEARQSIICMGIAMESEKRFLMKKYWKRMRAVSSLGWKEKWPYFWRVYLIPSWFRRLFRRLIGGVVSTQPKPL